VIRRHQLIITINLLSAGACLVELQPSCPVRCCRSLFHRIPSAIGEHAILSSLRLLSVISASKSYLVAGHESYPVYSLCSMCLLLCTWYIDHSTGLLTCMEASRTVPIPISTVPAMQHALYPSTPLVPGENLCTHSTSLPSLSH
jgi:hypothetical protein